MRERRRREHDLRTLTEELSSSPYRPIGRIGRGGMGALYEVEHIWLKKRLVVKLLHDPTRRDWADRLRIEAQTLAQLAHPNLLQVVDFRATTSGAPYIVAERLSGQTLLEVVRSRPLDTLEAVDLCAQALAGLAVAHQAGIVHRDVKLDNLFLCDGPQHLLKVIDFGVAKVMPFGSASIPPPAHPTEEGVMVGTPSFMAPEQVLGRAVDHRIDIYAMGIVLYRLVAGRAPFNSSDPIELARAHITELPPRPSDFADVAPALEEVILTALEKDPSHRFQTATAMQTALLRFRESQEEEATMSTLPWARALPFPVAQSPSIPSMRTTPPRQRRRAPSKDNTARFLDLATIAIALFTTGAIAWTLLHVLGVG